MAVRSIYSSRFQALILLLGHQQPLGLLRSTSAPTSSVGDQLCSDTFKGAIKSVLRILYAHHNEVRFCRLDRWNFIYIPNDSYLYVNLFCSIKLKFQFAGPQQFVRYEQKECAGRTLLHL
jgi:hypothetical protein